jgi:hypothetical protein
MKLKIKLKQQGQEANRVSSSLNQLLEDYAQPPSSEATPSAIES